ncbi:Arc family DNA-binding protein [Cereibacter sphaeroides f. sp. denitrificans]|nr:Arc family DNA-binding protein [Cereibacter sphaeroides f. sp. denitrificans]
MTVPTGRESDKFMLRLPDGMRGQLKAAAAINNRSMNAEIVARLEQSLASEIPKYRMELTLEQLKTLQVMLERYRIHLEDGAQNSDDDSLR